MFDQETHEVDEDGGKSPDFVMASMRNFEVKSAQQKFFKIVAPVKQTWII